MSTLGMNSGLLTRLLGVTIFTLVVQQIVLQLYRPFFNSIFAAKVVRRYHIVMGTFTFLLAVLHPLSHYLSNYLAGEGVLDSAFGVEYEFGMRLVYLLGPLALTVMTITVASGLLRRWKPLQVHWLKIHRFNYLLFVIALFHSWNIGSDLQTSMILRGVWSLYAVVIGVGFALKYYIEPRLTGARGTEATEKTV